MKTLIFSVGLIIANLAVAQDTIYERSGNIFNGKVTEVTQSEIKYKKTTNADGPTYTLNKEDVTLIHYKNGSKDVFVSNPNSTDNNQQQTIVNNNYYQPCPYGYGPRVRIYVGPPAFIRPPGFYYGYPPHPYFYHHRRWCW
jgi:hypothetical protein